MNNDNSDTALQPVPVITAPGERYSGASRSFQGIPGIECSTEGQLWATWYSGGHGEGPDNYVLLVTSEDDGKSWSEPLLIIDPPGTVRAFDPVVWFSPDGTLWLFWAQSEDRFDGRAGVWAITNLSPQKSTFQWTSPRRLCDGIMMNKPTVLSSGEWILPVAIWAHKQHKDMAHPDVPAVARTPHVVVSRDGGQTFERRGGVQMENRSCDEHMVIERRDGSLWMLTRRSDGIGESTSNDKGVSWTPGQKSTLQHPSSRFYIRRLASGKVLLVKHHNTTERSFLTAFLSEDDGESWQGGLLLDERARISYPDGTQSEDGRIYIIYDRERRGAKEILMAVFKEEDVVAQKVVSKQTRLKVLVNRGGAVTC